MKYVASEYGRRGYFSVRTVTSPFCGGRSAAAEYPAMTSIQLTQKKRVTLTRVSLMQQEIEATWHLCVAARCVRLRSPMTATVLLRTALLPTHPRVRLCHALHSHVHESTDGLHAMRDSLAIDGVG